MEKKYCKQCEYYLQHYALTENRLFKVYCGHCTNRTAKRKRPDAAACDAFIPGVPDEDAFASKTFLTKHLLEQVLTMELLPPIEDATSQKIR